MLTKRKFQMTRVSAGSYLLPSNDAQTLWHIYSFEDGPSYGLQDEVTDRTYWACSRYNGTIEQALQSIEEDLQVFDYIHHENWEATDLYQRTRRDAIECALSYEEEDA